MRPVGLQALIDVGAKNLLCVWRWDVVVLSGCAPPSLVGSEPMVLGPRTAFLRFSWEAMVHWLLMERTTLVRGMAVGFFARRTKIGNDVFCVMA